MRNRLYISVIFALFCFGLNAQNGTIRGRIYDAKTGESITGATIVPLGTSTGTISDLDGKFNLSIAAGTYTLQISFISYQTLKMNEVVVKSGEVTLLNDIKLQDVAIEYKEVKISAKKVSNNENALIAMKRHSANVIDGISASKLRQTGDGNVASSMKRVPGISVEGGKYVYVRGLGDRYTKTTLNGLEIPGLDPDRNTLQMDLFPTSIIDNVVVNKTFSADLPADFTGGIVDINLKDFPEEKIGKLSVSTEYNPSFHFKSDYLTYEGGSLDFLGFDDGTRKIPATTDIPFLQEAYISRISEGENGADYVRYLEILHGFNPTMGAMKQMSLMDFGLGFSIGNQVVKEKRTIGSYFAISYKNSTEFYEDAEYGRYGLSGDKSVNEMEVREYQKGDFGVNNVLLSMLTGFAVKNEKAKYKFNLLHLQNGESKAGVFDFEGSDQGSDFISIQHNLDYSQRSLSSFIVDAKYKFKDPKWSLIWKVAPTYSRVYDPDIRFTRYEIRNDEYIIGTEVGFPERIWRDLNEINVSGVVHATRDYKFKERKSKLKFGGALSYKNRDFAIRKYSLNVKNIELTGDPNEIMQDYNLWPIKNGGIDDGTYFEFDFYPVHSNKFNSTAQNAAAYASTEIGLLANLNTVVGVRMEKYSQFYTGQDQQGNHILDNDKVLDDLDFVPSLNFIYSLTEVMNLRLSYSKTIARPSFKELSYAEIYDPITGRTFIGGLHEDINDNGTTDESDDIVYWDGNLVSSDIHNVDLRWELLHLNGQMISVSTFYKKFINPIEIVQYATQTGAFQPRNVGDGDVYGAEFEIRQNLSSISERLENFNFSSNFSYIESRIELSATEYDSRVENAREGQTIEKYRDMAGQAPYLINAGIAYKGSKEGFWENIEAGLYYNVQGPTLIYPGIVDRPDIYSEPFHSLNFNSNFTFGKEKKSQVSLKISNLLFDKKEKVYKSYNAENKYFEQLYPGFAIKVGYSLSLF